MAIPEKRWKPLGKKYNWREGNNCEFSFELTVLDELNRKIDRFMWNNTKRFREIIELLRLKYGMEYR